MNHPSVRIGVIGGHGSDSIRELVTRLPENCGLALVVSIADQPELAGFLRAHTKLAVVDAQSGQRLEPNRIYVAPPGQDIVVRRGELQVMKAETPGVQLDRLLRSVADDAGPKATAAILRGLGTDGSLGIKRIKEAGGSALAEASTDGDFGEMPRAAIATGAIDQVVPIQELARQLCAIGVEPELVLTADESERSADEEVSDTLRDILALVRIRTGHDFAAYKRATMYRRVARRMQVCHSSSITDYLQFLRDHPGELSHLLGDFLISVTNFFRDPDAYDVLAEKVITRLFADRGPGDQIRVWVAGCATGEEAYSLGILLLEHAGKLRDAPRIQIFATDIDETALAEARAGRYPETIAVDVSRDRLERFFVKESGFYRVNQELRELVLFSPHNVLRDPPFSRLDLVSCRNLMIYLNREAQNRVLGMFHFGLRPDGFLFLGSSESVERTNMFGTVDAAVRLFCRQAAPSALLTDTIVGAGRWQPLSITPPPSSRPERTTPFGEMHHRLVERYAPPSILVDGELEIVHVSEHAGRFLQVAGGEPTRDLLRLIHPALRLDLRSAIYASRQPRRLTETRRVVFEDDGKSRAVELRVRAVDLAELGANAALIYLDETEPTEPARPAEAKDAMIEPVVREIEDELRRTRDQLRTTIEQYETSLDELKASNEELQAINEELRSASEELETSKEEVQSANEELTTLNHELKVKIEEVSHANGDLQNLMSSTDIGVVFLDRALQIKRYTPRALELFNMIPTDIGRPLAHVTHRLDTGELPELAQRVLVDLRSIERDVTSRDGRLYLLRILPYRSLEDRIDGVVLTFVDVDELRSAVASQRRSEAALETSETRLRASLKGAPVVVLTIDSVLQITWGYVLGRELEVRSAEARSLVAAADADRFEAVLREVLVTGESQRIDLGLLVGGVQATYAIVVERAGTEATVVGFDITPSKLAESLLRDADRRKDEFLATLSHELRNPLTPLRLALDVAKMSGGRPDQLAKSQAIMERQITMISELVDELLDLSRITQGKVVLSKVPLDPAVIIEAALEATQPSLREQGHELRVELPKDRVFVLGDLKRLSQVMTNLLSNAAKYTPARGLIHVSVGADEARNVVTFRVRDNGIGIASEMLPRIFDIFVQCRDESGRSRGGLGIGLNLVKRLVELHGGRVSATSAGPDQGTEVVVEIPRHRGAVA